MQTASGSRNGRFHTGRTSANGTRKEAATMVRGRKATMRNTSK